MFFTRHFREMENSMCSASVLTHHFVDLRVTVSPEQTDGDAAWHCRDRLLLGQVGGDSVW